MNQSHNIVERRNATTEARQSIAAAKANLLAWAEDCDHRSATSTRSMATMATTGMFAIIGGMVVARIVVSSRKTGTASRWMKKAIATLIFRAVMARVRQQIQTRGSAV
jgi:hypothetical protein